MKKEILVTREEETRKLAESIANQIHIGDVIALYGELGAGKTYFAQAFCKALGVNEYVSSPSFVIMNEYEGRYPVAHLDLYRLGASEEVLELGLEDIIEQRVTLIEWPDIAEELLPQNTIHIHFNIENEFRKVKIFSKRELVL